MGERAVHVLIDGVAFENTHQRGVQRYYAEMLRRFPDDTKCTLYFNQPYQASPPPGVPVVVRPEMFPVARHDIGGRVRRKLRHLFHPTPLPKASVFHSTFFSRSPIPGLPEVVTVHDMVAECFPYHFAAAVEPVVAQKRACILNAAAIITISEATRDDLIRIYPEVSSRVMVIHHGADHLQSPGVDLAESEGTGRYALFVGDRAGYKNFTAVIMAVAGRDWPHPLKLMVVGNLFTDSELRLLRYHGVESKVVHAGRVADSKLKALYQQASAFIFPSLCEGFGFPLLEAQQMRVPVLASDIPVFREIGGAGVLFFNPGDPGKISAALQKILEPDERMRCVTLGVENVRRFSWDECAKKTAGLFRSVAGS